jgi:hypothetical protein
MRKSTFALRLQPSLREEVRKLANEEGVALTSLSMSPSPNSCRHYGRRAISVSARHAAMWRGRWPFLIAPVSAIHRTRAMSRRTNKPRDRPRRYASQRCIVGWFVAIPVGTILTQSGDVDRKCMLNPAQPRHPVSEATSTPAPSLRRSCATPAPYPRRW